MYLQQTCLNCGTVFAAMEIEGEYSSLEEALLWAPHTENLLKSKKTCPKCMADVRWVADQDQWGEHATPVLQEISPSTSWYLFLGLLVLALVGYFVVSALID